MPPRDHNTRPKPPENPDVLFMIGPGMDPTDPTHSRSGDPDADLLARARREARCEDEEARAAAALLRRIVIAFVLIVIVGAICFVVMPYYGMNLPPIMPILAFAVIAIASLIAGPKPKPAPKLDADGRPIGCCPGPRPLRSFRDDD